ncbi:MAG TPA: Gfo/Idh/MocA family oxidoreductase [Planctomycetaceae bacterium]|nr:Gfo/Idh/MocA family oxidoreductase [Planctomycetaceae bacterium]
MPEKHRVAIIGSTGRGDYGHGLDIAWKEIPRAEIVAVADENETGRAAAARRTGAKAAYADFREMLDKERPAIVSICQRWVDRHHEMALSCVERGIHVFMEKPFCRTLMEADEIVRACESTHAKLAIAHQTRYCPVLPVVQRMIEEGKLGTILELRARGKEDHRGGAEDLWVLGSHLLNMMQFFAGSPLSCYASITNKGVPITRADVFEGNEGLGPLAGDAITALYQFPDAVTGFFGSRRSQEGKPSRFGLWIMGSKGIVEYLTGYLPAVHFLADPAWSPARSGAKWETVTSAGIGKPEPLASAGISAGNVAAINDLIDAIEMNRQPKCSVYEARATIEMIMAVFESQRLQRSVRLPLENRRHPLTML